MSSNPSTVPEELIPQLQAAYASTGLKALCASHNLDFTSVIKTAKLEGWPIQPIATKTEAVVTIQTKQTDLADRAKSYTNRMADTIEKVLPHLEDSHPEEILDNIDAIEKFDKIARRTLKLDDPQTTNHIINVNVLAAGLESFVPEPEKPAQAIEV